MINRTIRIANFNPGYTETSGNYKDKELVVWKLDATNGDFELTMPSAKDTRDVVFVLKKVDSSTNSITINPKDDETIDGYV